jgi:hypothetical protein
MEETVKKNKYSGSGRSNKRKLEWNKKIKKRKRIKQNT